ncbi:MAG: transaldolase [Phycisphaerae bacterium]
MITRLRQMAALGQAAWIDYISRELLRSGRLEELIGAGIVGMTSNPTIFQKAISVGRDYDDDIRDLSRNGADSYAIYEALALADICEAADKLRPVYNETHGRDGYVSIEVNPAHAHHTDATIHEARRLFQTLHRPNIMIKVPATDAGLPAITTLIGEGINVNVTLIFAGAMYERVMQAYLDGLHRLHASRRPLASVSSVASFFVSRVDTLVDRLLKERIAAGADGLEHLLGKAAIANAKIAYGRYKAVFAGEPFALLRDAGARVQRPLWASTSTKDPAYTPTKYVDPLIGPNTVNTLPPQTLDALRLEGNIAQALDTDLEYNHGIMQQLAAAGIDLTAVTDQLLREGVQAFADSFEQLLRDIDAKRAALEQAA